MIHLLQLLWGCSTTTPPDDRPPPCASLTDRACVGTAVTAELEAAGYSVRPGAQAHFLAEDCAAADSCYGSNPSSPYGLALLPPAPDEVPPSQVFQLSPDLNEVWRLGPREAVLLLGRTPPAARYLSYRSYLFSRVVDGEEIPVFASLGDALNPTNLAFAGPDAYDRAFDADLALISTADAQVALALRRALARAGVDEDHVHIDVLDPSVLRMGTGPEADGLMLILRSAVFEDQPAADAYVADPPALVYRISPPPGEGQALTAPSRAERGTGETEHHLLGALDALEDAVRATHADRQILLAPADPWTADPELCIATSERCFGEISDAAYFQTPHTWWAADSTWFVAIGVNHRATGKARYAGAAIVDVGTAAGVAGADDRVLDGSAARYLPAHPDVDLLFALDFARDCGGAAHCVEVPTAFPGVGTSPWDQAFFQFRAYLEPGRTVGPLDSELVAPRVLKLSDPE